MSNTNVGTEINEPTIGNCRALRNLRLPLTSTQQDWLLALAEEQITIIAELERKIATHE